MAKWGEVLSVLEYAVPTEDFQIRKMFRYRIKTAKGAHVTVDIAEEQNTPELVEPVLRVRALAQDKILGL